MGLWKAKNSAVILVNEETSTIVVGSESRIDFVNRADIHWDDQQKSREEWQKFFPIARRKQLGGLCLVLPRRLFFSKQLLLPSIDQEEIRKMVNLQINQYLPYPSSHAVWDIIIDSQKTAATSQVVLLSIQQDVVMKYIRLLTAVGLTPTHITVSSHPIAALATALETTALQVFFLSGYHDSEFCFASANKDKMTNHFYFSRAIVYGQKDFQTEKLKDFGAQVRLTFEAHRKSFPNYSVVSGYYLKDSKEAYSKDFEDLLTQESGVSWKELPREVFMKYRFPKTADLTVHMIAGAALLQKDFNGLCNFLSAELKSHHVTKRIRSRLSRLVFLILGVIVSITMAVSAPVYKKWEYARRLDEQLKTIENPFLESSQILALRTALTKSMNQRVSPLKLIEEIYRSVPQGLAFTRIQIHSKNELTLEGQAVQSSQVNDLQEKMIASQLFRDVRLERATRRASPLGEIVQFAISAKLQHMAHVKDVQ